MPGPEAPPGCRESRQLRTGPLDLQGGSPSYRSRFHQDRRKQGSGLTLSSEAATGDLDTMAKLLPTIQKPAVAERNFPALATSSRLDVGSPVTNGLRAEG